MAVAFEPFSLIANPPARAIGAVAESAKTAPAAASRDNRLDLFTAPPSSTPSSVRGEMSQKRGILLSPEGRVKRDERISARKSADRRPKDGRERARPRGLAGRARLVEPADGRRVRRPRHDLRRLLGLLRDRDHRLDER